MKPSELWPELPYEEWKETRETLHRWLQIVGKVRTNQAPWVNHGWHSTFYVSARGLTTSLIPGRKRSCSIEFDFVDHRLRILTTDAQQRDLALTGESVAEFYARFASALSDLSIGISGSTRPDEVADRTPFPKDTAHRTYDPEAARRFWMALVRVHRVFERFRSCYVGKCSPVQFFWGALDLAVTRFSGRRAPEHPGGAPGLSDTVVKEAYSHEVSSAGFWPGDERLPEPAFYSYAYPQPDSFDQVGVDPPGAYFHPQLREFILPYDEVRSSRDPDSMLLSFLQSTYEAAADMGGWDRARLEESRFLRELQSRQRDAGEQRKRAA